MSWTDEDGPTRDREQLLAQVVARGGALRRRRRTAISAMGSAVVLLLAVQVLVLVGRGDNKGTVVSASGGPASSVEPGPGPVSAQAGLGTSSPTSTTIGNLSGTALTVGPTSTMTRTMTTAATSSPTISPTTTTARPCRDSMLPSCGPFRWDPPPAPADPLTISVTYSPAQPKVGQTVVFSIVLSDPDTTPVDCGSVTLGDGLAGSCVASAPICPPRYGPWTPPAKVAHRLQLRDLSTSYRAAGTYTARFDYPAGTGCYDPYSTTATKTVTVVVT